MIKHWELQGIAISCFNNGRRLSLLHLTAHNLRDSNRRLTELDALEQELSRSCVDEERSGGAENVVQLVVDDWQEDRSVFLYRLQNRLESKLTLASLRIKLEMSAAKLMKIVCPSDHLLFSAWWKLCGKFYFHKFWFSQSMLEMPIKTVKSIST